mgnify:CR=1 FL=1
MSNQELKFGDEIEPTSKYADNKQRKWVFLAWGGPTDYGRVGILVDGVLEQDQFIHKDYIKKR